MDKNRSEVFGQFSYDESLTYEELLDVESTLIADLEALLLRAGATHLDFTPLGDALMCQCAFEAHKLYVYRKIAQEAAALLPRGVTGRLLCLDKSLAALHVYWIARGSPPGAENLARAARPGGNGRRRVTAARPCGSGLM